MKRPKIRIRIDGANAIKTAPNVKSKSAHIVINFLPYLSAKGPAINDPKAAPTRAIETIV
jgi:hypothetical protein